MHRLDEIRNLRRTRHCREGRLIKGISKDLSVSRATVRKVL